jgi:hypothetical protein
MSTLPALEHIRLQHHLRGSKVQPPSESSLRSLCHSPRRSLIFNSCGLSDAQCVIIADDFKSNKASATLPVLVVTRNYQVTSTGWDAFVNMLAINEQVVDFHLGEEGQWNVPSPEQRAKIDYFAGLNQCGRGELLRGPMEPGTKYCVGLVPVLRLIFSQDSEQYLFFCTPLNGQEFGDQREQRLEHLLNCL